MKLLKPQNKKQILMTVAWGLVILMAVMAGTAMLYPVAFYVLFHAKEQSPLSDATKAAPQQLMESLQYPLWKTTEPLTEQEIKDYFVTGELYFDKGVLKNASSSSNGSVSDWYPASLYHRLFQTANLKCKESYWKTLSVVADAPEYHVLQIPHEGEESKPSVWIAMEHHLPILLYYPNQTKPSANEMAAAAETLRTLSDTQDDSLRSYLAKIDTIYENCTEYENKREMLYDSLLLSNGENEPQLGNISLYDCCSLGEWQVCIDNNMTAMVCTMEQSYLILFYDAVEQEFCGFRIGFQPSDNYSNPNK